MLNNIDESILRNYYSKSFGLIGRFAVPNDAFETDDFDTYLALIKIQFPRISALHAAKSSGRADFQKLAENFDDPNEPDSELPGFFMLSRKKDCNLARSNIPPDVISLTIDRCKSVSGLNQLSNLQNLKNFSCVYCDSPKPEQFPRPVILDTLNINTCDRTCVETLLRGIEALSLEIYHVSDPVFSCRILKNQTLVSDLRIEAPFVRDTSALRDLPIKRLFLNRVAIDVDMSELLTARKKSLQELGIVSTRPFLPDDLEVIPSSLQRLIVPAFEEYRNEWINWAVLHPEIACVFSEIDAFNFPVKTPRISVAEIYRGIAILEFVKAKKIRYEISEDVALITKLDLSNGEIEDRVRPLARREKKKIEWSSEADMFVAGCVDLCTCRWLVDTVLSFCPEANNQR